MSLLFPLQFCVCWFASDHTACRSCFLQYTVGSQTETSAGRKQCCQTNRFSQMGALLLDGGASVRWGRLCTRWDDHLLWHQLEHRMLAQCFQFFSAVTWKYQGIGFWKSGLERWTISHQRGLSLEVLLYFLYFHVNELLTKDSPHPATLFEDHFLSTFLAMPLKGVAMLSMDRSLFQFFQVVSLEFFHPIGIYVWKHYVLLQAELAVVNETGFM